MSAWSRFGRRPVRYRPSVEQLEDRSVPSRAGRVLLHLYHGDLLGQELTVARATAKAQEAYGNWEYASMIQGSCSAGAANQFRIEVSNAEGQYSIFLEVWARFEKIAKLALRSGVLSAREKVAVRSVYSAVFTFIPEETTTLHDLGNEAYGGIPC
jgi:hypothetical protein